MKTIEPHYEGKAASASLDGARMTTSETDAAWAAARRRFLVPETGLLVDFLGADGLAGLPTPDSISLTVGSLVGTGMISANGHPGNTGVDKTNGYGPSGGGRIAIRLTDANAAFSAQDLARIAARGVTQATVNSCTNTSSARIVLSVHALLTANGGI